MPKRKVHKKRIVILGAGQVGRHLVRILSRDGYNVVLIDQKEDKIAETLDANDVSTILADGLDPAVYKEIGLNKNDAFIAVTTGDETNLLACSISKSFGCDTNIARVKKPYFTESKHSLFNSGFWKNLGIEVLFNQTELTVKEVKHLIENPGAEEAIEVHDKRVQLIAYRVKKSSLLCDHRLMGLRHVKKFENLVVAAVTTTTETDGNIIQKSKILNQRLKKRLKRSAIRKYNREDEVTLVPTGNYRIKEGDLLFICGLRQDFKGLGQLFDPELTTHSKHIFILGGNPLASTLAENLKDSYPKKQVYLIEPNKSKAYFQTERINPKVNILLGGIHNINTYKNEGLDENCVFIGASRTEDDNLLASILFKEETQVRTIAIVQKPTNKHLIPFLEIDAAVSPKLLLVDDVLHALQKSMFDVISAKGHNSELIEFNVPSSSDISNKQIKEIKFPSDSIIVTIFRNETVIIPKGDTLILPDDKVVVFTLKKAISEVQLFFDSHK